MAGIERRLMALEDAQRGRAVEVVRDFWRSLSVEECALMAAYATAENAGKEPPAGAWELAERQDAAGMEDVLRCAIG